jgi:NAD(P)-dependent dehydrogenase (short-subunit alcohol dehydrogenase family)
MSGTAAGDPPRVLIEAAEWTVGEATAGAFREAGWEVVTCTGPEGHALHCPFLTGEGCHLIEHADVVVVRLDLHDVRNIELLRRLAREHPDTGVVVELAGPLAEQLADELASFCLVTFPARTAELVAAARRCLGSSPGRAQVEAKTTQVTVPSPAEP